MKSAMIFTIFVIVGLGVVSGIDSRRSGRTVVIPRPRSQNVDPFAPAGVNLRQPRPFAEEVWRPQAAQNADTVQYTTTLNAQIFPSEYNGDVRDLPRVSRKENEKDESFERQMHEPPSLRASLFNSDHILPDITDVPNNFPSAAMPGPIQSFNGMSLNDDCAGAKCGIGQPPDANGDVGPNHYILTVNFGIAVYSKSGALLAKFSEDSLWRDANSGTPCDHQSHGDPVVIYDQFADRWIISNFAFGFNSNGPANPIYQCFAVSKSGDPVSGGWRLYAMQTDTGAAGQPPQNTLSDYPKLGNWNDGCLYMTANEFAFPGGKYLGTMFASINKSDMYNGLPLTSSVGFINDPSGSYTLIPSNISGAKNSDSLPNPGTPNYLVSQARSSYTWEVRKFTPGTSPKICGGGGSLSGPINIAQQAWDNPDDVNQPNANPLGSVGERLMQKVQYRRIGAKESLWVVHTIESPANSSLKSQWAQLDVSGGNVRTTPVQEQVYTPDTSIERWVPSLAVDHSGNMALGYNMSSSSMFPSIGYSGRLITDPLNQLSQGETILVTGNGSQRNNCEGGPCRRWGDYSSMSVDPVDDCTFWYVNQYYDSQSNGDSGNWQTRIGSFKFPSCVGAIVFRNLSITSSNPDRGCPIKVSPSDNDQQLDGVSPFSRKYVNGITVTLTTEPRANAENFLEWQRDGVSYSKNLTITVVMDADHTMKAVYNPDTTRTLSVKSSNPASGANVTLTPSDVSGKASGNTGFDANFTAGTQVRVKAPTTVGGNVFKRWLMDGFQWDTAAQTTVTMDDDHEITAVYDPPSSVTVTVQSNPSGLRLTVDGASFTSSQQFTWAPGSTHTITADAATSNGDDAQLAFNNWSDGGSISHTVTATGSNTYTANCKQQYRLTVINGDGGVVRPLTNFYNAREPVGLVATPQVQFSFDGWVGTGADSYTGLFRNIAIDMTAPVTEAANFSLIDTTVQLSSATYSASETTGFFNVTVTRTGPPTNIDSVTYATSDGTAKEGRDYVNAQGVVTFNKGETTKTFPLLIINNGYVDPSPRTVNIKLVEAQGAFLGSTTSATLTIVDDDKTNGPNTVDDPRAFVQFHYFDFLGRYPDSGGWDFWTNQITSCGSDKACTDGRRINASGAFFLSIEFQATGYLVERIYKTSYGDATATSGLGGPHQIKVPIIRFSEFLSGKEFVGRGVIGGQAGYEDLLENNKQDFVRALIRTQRFIDAYPNSLTPAQYVDKMNQNAGNVLTPTERNDAIAQFEGQPDTNNIRVRRHVLLAVAECPGLVAAEKNRAFVLSQYYGYLRRNPDDPPDKPGDYTGYDFWLSKLNEFKGDFVAAQMVQAFLASGEYRGRFGP